MKRALYTVFSISSARWVTPAVVAAFALLYVALSFVTDEPLVTMVRLGGEMPLLPFLFLIPLNLSSRIVSESILFRKRTRTLKRGAAPDAGAFNESVYLPQLHDVERGRAWLSSNGYHLSSNGALAAARGIPLFPARFLFLLALALFFVGVALSLSTRRAERAPLIEGEPLPPFVAEGRVESIRLMETPGNPVLARTLKVTADISGKGKEEFDLYPPGRAGGYFLYHRYLGVAPLVRLAAPDHVGGGEDFYLLLIHPPGRQDVAVIQNSPYQLDVTLVEPISGADPYETGDFVFRITCKRENKALFSRDLQVGNSLTVNDITISIPVAKRFVVTDFLVDNGISLLWLSGLLLSASFLYFLPVRLLNPRREIVLCPCESGFVALSYAEGKRRQHDGVYQELLDLVVRHNTLDTAK